MPQIREVAGQARWPLRSFATGLGIEGPRAGSCKRVGEGKQPCVPSLPLREHGKGKERPGAVAQEGSGGNVRREEVEEGEREESNEGEGRRERKTGEGNKEIKKKRRQRRKREDGGRKKK